MRVGSRLWIVLVLVVSCKDDKRERCVAMSDHVARVIAKGDAMTHFMALGGTHRLIDKCVADFSDTQLDCLLAATSRTAVAACDSVK
jgi:hypothetical protein